METNNETELKRKRKRKETSLKTERKQGQEEDIEQKVLTADIRGISLYIDIATTKQISKT